MENGQKFDEFTPDQLRQLEARWKSDIAKELSDIRGDVKWMKDTFQQARGAVILIKWGAAGVVACAGIAAWISQHFTFRQ